MAQLCPLLMASCLVGASCVNSPSHLVRFALNFAGVPTHLARQPPEVHLRDGSPSKPLKETYGAAICTKLAGSSLLVPPMLRASNRIRRKAP